MTFMMTNIMIVEDDMMLAMEIEEDLEGSGYEVSGVASTGEEALEMAKVVKPDLILMDIKLPGKLDGIEVANEIQRDLDSTVVFISGQPEEELIGRGREIGHHSYLRKPFRKEQVLEVIHCALHKKEAEGGLPGWMR